MTERRTRFRIKLTVAVYQEKRLLYKNDLVVDSTYERRSEARAHIKKEIQSRIQNSNFFRSPRVDFDLVQYSEEATRNTYLRYRIIEEPAEKNTLSSEPEIYFPTGRKSNNP